ncbi:MAG: ParB/RepB/Spo0J family partition protein [Bdellovibrionota bacterium]
MDNLKDRKVLALHSHRELPNQGEKNAAETIGWEEEYFHRLSGLTGVNASGANVMGTKSELYHSGEILADDLGRDDVTADTFVLQIPVDQIQASPFQTREILGEDQLQELKSSIVSRGVIQPIVVRTLPLSPDHPAETKYELVAGERRFRAAKLAGLSLIPAVIRRLDDQESVELSIIENAQRENLNPIEEARAYQLLAEQFRVNHAEIAKIVGKNRVTISNSLRLLHLAPEVIELLRTGELTAGHGRALLMIEGAENQLALARLAVKKALSVRALENIVSKMDEELFEEEEEPEESAEDQSLRRLETKISGFLGIENVKLNTNPEGKKRLTLVFDTEAAWKRFVGKIRD